MTDREPAQVMRSLCYEVLQATSMLLFLLSSIATSRRNQYSAPGVASPLVLSGLPGLCLSPCIIQVPDEELYGPTGAATQMAYKGWITEVFGLWENRYRNILKDSLGKNAIPPEMQAFGDLRYIRNDFLHSGSCTASEKCSRRCEVLKWYKTGDRIVLSIQHVLDFLNQTGVLTMGGHIHDTASRSCLLTVIHDKNTLLNWSPKPKLVSVRTLDEGKDTDPPYKGVTVVFDNGLFGNVPIQLDKKKQWKELGSACVRGDGYLVFENGTVFDSDALYRNAVDSRESGGRENKRPRLPVSGPWIRIRKDKQS